MTGKILNLIIRHCKYLQETELCQSLQAGAILSLFYYMTPWKIYTVDINPSQSFLLELKNIAMKHLSHQEYLEFIGLRTLKKDWQVYRASGKI